jgi:predicted amidophosphoribosyltransferase
VANFCSKCAFPIEKSYNFCPKCGDDIKTNANAVDDGNVNPKQGLQTTSTSTRKFSLQNFALASFAAFKSTKEKLSKVVD